LEVPLRILAVGSEAVRHLPALVQTLAEAGRRYGLGEEQLRFELVAVGPPPPVKQLDPADLPAHPGALPGQLPRLGIGLTTLLFLREQQQPHERRRLVEVPSFAHLMRAALRTVSELFRLFGEPLNADFTALRAAAERVPLLDHCYEPFTQERNSTRTQQRYAAHGLAGGGVYGDVPLALLPWLLWGGRFHVGGHRVAGAGGWRLVLD
jgi:hypothetical protein